MTAPTHAPVTPEVANPWRSMWLRPRQTIQSIVDRDPTWSIVLLLKALGQVHGFSAWRALGTAVIAFALVFVPIALLVLALFMLR